MNKLTQVNKIFLYFLTFTLFSFYSCREDDPKPAGVPDDPENQYVNKWIKENMDFYYLWNEEMPQGADLNVAPDEYFESLIHADDRFSWIQDNYLELLNSLQGINEEAGYEYVLYREDDSSDKVVAQILYVKPGSPAAEAGLQRGDLISKINGKGMTTENYRTILQGLKEDHTLVYQPLLDPALKSFGEEKSVSLATLQYVENPNYLSTVIETGGKKIGYFVYNFFASGPGSGSKEYDDEMAAVFQEFKNAGISDLVLDLRFNSGGSEVSAKKLASLVGFGVDHTKVFFKRQYNAMVEEAILADQNTGPSFLTNYFADEVNNIGSLLSGQRVYILTSSRTASASELIINSLKPYMEVYLIGDVTYGKNVGSITIFEENDSKNKWGLQPIIVKVSNSEGFADYGNGFTPDIVNKDNSLGLYPLGDTREALLSEAIAQITGSNSGRVSAQGQTETREILQHSMDLKRRSFNLIMEEDLPFN